MSVKKIHDQQPKEFEFSNENLKKAEEILKYLLVKMEIATIDISAELKK